MKCGIIVLFIICRMCGTVFSRFSHFMHFCVLWLSTFILDFSILVLDYVGNHFPRNEQKIIIRCNINSILNIYYVWAKCIIYELLYTSINFTISQILGESAMVNVVFIMDVYTTCCTHTCIITTRWATMCNALLRDFCN